MTYILITPARNEVDLIEQTILAVIHQTVKPAKWVIVSDGSTDGTAEIVNKYVREHPWIELARMSERAKRHFGGKAIAFNTGRDRTRQIPYDIIGNLDADITLDEDHFDLLLNKFAQDKTLGVAGTLSVTGLHADAVVFPVNGWLVYTPCVPIPASAINTAVAAALTAGGSSKTGYVVITGFTAKP